MPQSTLLQVRYLSGERGGGRKGFLGEFLDNLKQELSKNKEMKENIKKFREEAKKLEDSEALRQARRKYVRFVSPSPTAFVYMNVIKIGFEIIKSVFPP